MCSLLNLEDARKGIDEILKTMTGDKINICYQIYQEIIQHQGNEPELLCYFFENSEQIESDGSNWAENIIENEKKYEYIDEYGQVIDGILECLLKKNYQKEVFYKKLWEAISENPLLDSINIQVFAIYYIWIDVRIPYFELDPGIKMSGDEYREIRRKIIKKIQKARFILSVPVEQKTERASRLAALVDSLESEKERAVLMAQILLLWEQKKNGK